MLLLLFIQGSVGKSTISPVPSAAQMRTMRKGSTDHLALDIDSESSRLISNEETDEDKGFHNHMMFFSSPQVAILKLETHYNNFLLVFRSCIQVT